MQVMPPDPEPGPAANSEAQLQAAREKIRDLELSRDAMLSSIDSLKVLVSNEKAQSRVAKRRLATAEKSAQLATSLQEQLDARDAQIAALQSAKMDTDALREEHVALKEQCATLKGIADHAKVSGDAALQQTVADRDCCLRDLEQRLREECGKVSALNATLAELPTLRAQLDELQNEMKAKENELQVKEEALRAASSAELIEAGEKEAPDMMSSSNMKKKLMELKIARNVIAEKDKLVKSMRISVSNAEARELESVFASKLAEERIKGVEQTLTETVEKVEMLQGQLAAAEERRKAAEAKATDAETALVEACMRLKALEGSAKEFEAVRKEHAEFRACIQERLEIAEDQRTEAVDETKKLEKSLQASEKEVARLQSMIAKRGAEIDDMGTSSPCSMDATSDAPMISSVSECESVEKLNELEEQAKLARSSYQQKCLEAQTLASSVSENATTIVTLNRALLVSRSACDDKHRQLEESMAKASGLEKTLRKARTELAGRVQECAALEKRIIDDLEPTLSKTNKLLDQRVSELQATRAEFDLHIEVSEKNHTALEKEVANVSARLQNTLGVLSETQNKLTQSERKAADLDVQIVDLKDAKRENLKIIEELQGHCEHRRLSLIALQERLTQVEQHVAEKEQAALDAIQSKERLSRFLVQAHDRQSVAERRAARKDSLVLELEERTEELSRSHKSIRDHWDEKTEELRKSELENAELREVVDVKESALQSQASLACSKEELFESLAAELRNAIKSKDGNLRTVRTELQSVERRAKSLAESLAGLTAKVKILEQDLADSGRQNTNLLGEKNRLEAKLEEAHDEFSRLKAEYVATREDLSMKDKQICAQLLSITEKGSQIAGMRAEKAELEQVMAEVRNELGSEKTNNDRLVAQVVTLEETLKNVTSDLATCEEELAMRSTEADSFCKSLEYAQTEVVRLENSVVESEQEAKESATTIKNLESALARTKQQLSVLESHLDGHDTLLIDSREKEEALVKKNEELEQAKEYIERVEGNIKTLHKQLTAKTQEVDVLIAAKASYESAKGNLEEVLAEAQHARVAAESTLSSTTASLSALEKSTDEEIEELKATVASLKMDLDEKESSLSCTSDTLSQASMQSQVAKEQLIDSRSRTDRLFSRLTATEHELASKKESLDAMEEKFQAVQEKLKSRENDIEKLERSLVERNQSLSLARSRVDDLTNKAKNIAKGELLTLQTKLEAKEKAIANLHNWCCFINGKLNTAEKALSERDVELEVSSTAFRKIEMQRQHRNEIIAMKDSHIRVIESSRIVEQSELRSRIQSLQTHLAEAKADVENAKRMISCDGDDVQASLIAVSEELSNCKDCLKAKEMEYAQAQARSKSLHDTVKTYERDLAAANRTIESLTLDLGMIRSEVSSKRDAKDVSDKNAALEVSKVRSETAYLLVELRKAEAELSAANENAKTWQVRAEELQPLAESTLETQRAMEMLSSRLVLAEKDSKHCIDLLKSQLEEARRERDVAERDCSSALADYAAMRARLTDSHGAGLGKSSFASSSTLCTVTFTLDGHGAPGSQVMVYLLGGDTALGKWNPAHRIPVRVAGKGKDGLIRKCDVAVPCNVSTMYKFAADGPDGKLVWEGGENRSLCLQGEMLREIYNTWRS